MDNHYDVIVVGGRCAGAATAMLLARGGLKVLSIEAARRGTDTLSTHALMRGGVLQLHRWGLLDAVVASGTPAIRATQFIYGDDVETVDIRPGDGIAALRAPRRTVLDVLLLDAAGAAGAEIRSPARVTRLLTVTAGCAVSKGSRVGPAHPFVPPRRSRSAPMGATRWLRGLSTRSFGAAARRRARSSTDTSPGSRATATNGRIDPESLRASCRPVRAWPASGPGSQRGSTPRGPKTSKACFRLALAEVAPEIARSIRRSARRSAARLPWGAGLYPILRWSGLGVGRRRRVLQGPHHRARHHRRPA